MPAVRPDANSHRRPDRILIRRHYLDHASTTPLRPEARDAMVRWLGGAGATDQIGAGVAADPGRVHTEGRIVRAAIEDARDQVAAFLRVRPRQIIFTSGGTEAVNAAVWGATRAAPGRPVVFADVEHSAVREASSRSAPTVTLPVGPTGRIDPDHVTATLKQLSALNGVSAAEGEAPGAGASRPPAALVHCQWANHEVGTLQPTTEIVARCGELGVPVHVDAAAACGHVPLDLSALGADLVSISAHKLGGPPGVGALVVRRGLRLEPLIVGGDQERARRGGMENVPAIVGFGAAAAALTDVDRLAGETAAAHDQTVRLLALATAVDDITVYGDPVDRLPHLVCFGVGGVEAEPVLLGLDQAGVAAHSGSSCSSEALAPSPVLGAMGADADHSLRLSVGWSTTDADVDAFALAFPQVVSGLRALRR